MDILMFKELFYVRCIKFNDYKRLGKIVIDCKDCKVSNFYDLLINICSLKKLFFGFCFIFRDVRN